MNQLINKINKGMLPDESELTLSESEWYKKVSDLDISLIEQDYAEEYIFHDVDNVQIKMHGITLFERTHYTREEFDTCLQIICLKNHIKWNVNNPFVSFDYKSYRLTLIHPCALKSKVPKLFLRVLNQHSFHPTDFQFDFLNAKNIIQKKKNVLIAGSTGSGKTSFINSLLSLCDEDEHIVIAEDTYELISPHKNTTRFLSQAELSQYSLAQYMSYAMRMRPDRIILGELRSQEVIAFLLALNSGHNGLLSTIHANNCRDAIDRVALLYKIFCERDIPYSTILKLICQNIDEIIFLENKKVIEHVKVLGTNEKNVFLEEIDPKAYSSQVI